MTRQEAIAKAFRDLPRENSLAYEWFHGELPGSELVEDRIAAIAERAVQQWEGAA
jgi:hypothetical protein